MHLARACAWRRRACAVGARCGTSGAGGGEQAAAAAAGSGKVCAERRRRDRRPPTPRQGQHRSGSAPASPRGRGQGHGTAGSAGTYTPARIEREAAVRLQHAVSVRKADYYNYEERNRRGGSGPADAARQAAPGAWAVHGGVLVLALSPSPAAELTLRNVDSTSLCHRGVDDVRAALRAAVESGSAALYRDTALVKLALQHLPPPGSARAPAELQAAMRNIARNIDFAAADEWAGDEAVADRTAQLEWMKKIATTLTSQKAMARAADATEYESKTSLDKQAPEDLQVEGREVVKAASRERQSPPAAPSTTAPAGSAGGTTAAAAAVAPMVSASYQQVKRDLAAFMGAGANAPPDTTGFEIHGPLGDPHTTYSCIACGTPPLTAMDLVVHVDTPAHQSRALQGSGSRAEEDALLHALKVQQGWAWAAANVKRP